MEQTALKRLTIGALAILSALCLGAATAGARQPRSQSQLLQDGIVLLETRGDYRTAIPVLERAVEGPDRALSARALLYLALAHERLGTTRARDVYQRIINDFTDQGDVVSQARSRLTALDARNTPPARSVTVRRLWGSDFTPTGPPSTDGRLIPGVSQSGDLALRDVTTMEVRRVVARGESDAVTDARFSPDASQIVSGWWVNQSEFEIRVSTVKGERVRALLRRHADHAYLAGWFPDGRGVLAWFQDGDGNGEFGRVDVNSGSWQLVARIKDVQSLTGSIAPDGRTIVYDYQSIGSPQFDIGLIGIATGVPRTVIAHAANDMNPTWTSDGRVLFASDRTGTLGLWLVEIENGEARAEPRLIRRDIGPLVTIAGLSAAGALIYRLDEGLVDVHTVALDPQRAAPQRVARRIEGLNLFPDWAPDSRRVAYTSRRGHLPFQKGGQALVISDREGDAERVQTTELANMAVPRWSPDGRSLAVRGTLDGVTGVHRIDVESGAIRTIVRDGSDGPIVAPFEWTRDGRGLIHVASGFRGIARFDLESGQTEMVYRAPEGHRVMMPALSRDGQRLAVPEWPNSNEANLLVVPVVGGNPRVIHSVTKPEMFSVVGWRPDDTEVYIAKRASADPNAAVSLLRVPVNGDPPVETGIVVPTMRDVRLSPDGRFVAFTAGAPTRATWMLENFLPTPRTPAAAQRDRRERQ
jgi:Tol biopolymer transport system component